MMNNNKEPTNSRESKLDEPTNKSTDPLTEAAIHVSAHQDFNRREEKHPLEWAIAIMLFFTLLATGTAAYYSRQQWLTADDQEKRTLRAYISARIEKYPDISSDNLDFTVVYKNHGQTPAIKMNVWVRMVVDDYPLPEFAIHQARFAAESMRGDEYTLFPGDERRAMSANGMDQFGKIHILAENERTAIKAGLKTLWVFGEATYRDVFGSDHFTHYRLYMSGRYMTSINKLFWAEQGNEAN